MDTVSGSRRLIAFHIGFLPTIQLVYKANSMSGDYYQKMNCENFQLGYTPSHSKPAAQQCSVYGHSSYQSKVHNKPGKYAKKQGMVDWLWSNGCLADIKMRKTVLCDSIEKLQP
jgi:hypothetical protein